MCSEVGRYSGLVYVRWMVGWWCWCEGGVGCRDVMLRSVSGYLLVGVRMDVGSRCLMSGGLMVVYLGGGGVEMVYYSVVF